MVDGCWDDVSACLERACDTSGGRFNISWLREQVGSGGQTLWILEGDDGCPLAAATTSFADYPSRRLLTISFLGALTDSSSRPVWFNDREIIISTLSKWARENGCDGIEIIGRRGWLKALSPLGFNVSATVMELGV
jgi:hypothetical protein